MKVFRYKCEITYSFYLINYFVCNYGPRRVLAVSVQESGHRGRSSLTPLPLTRSRTRLSSRERPDGRGAAAADALASDRPLHRC